MDPNETLRQILELTKKLIKLDDEDDFETNRNVMAQYGAALAERIDNLDEWIKKGGFLPERWMQKSEVAQ